MAATLGVETIQHTNGTTAVTVGTNGSVTAAGTVNADGLDITENTNARVYSSDGIGEVGLGNFAFQASNAAGNALKPFGFRGEDLRFATASEAMRIDNSGHVGINNTAPANYLEGELVVGNGTKDQYINVVTGTGNAAGLCFQDTTGTSIVGGLRYTHSDNALALWANGAERMRIDSSGNSLVGTTSNIAANAKIFAKGSGVGIALGYGTGSAEYRHLYMNSGDGAMYVFNNTNYANLSASGAWTNASDRRIKKNIVDIKYGLEDVLKIQPRSYQMKEVSGDYIGLIAQEVEEIIPEVVSGDPEKQLTLDYGSLVAVAFKAIKELSAKNDALEARLAAVEA